MKQLKKFLRYLCIPIKVIPKHLLDTFIWVMFTLVASQIGTIINLINRCIFAGWDFQAALCPESASGTFYTFALVMMSSLLSPLFISIIGKEVPKYNKIKIVLATILVFLLILAAAFYVSSTQNIEYYKEYAALNNSQVEADKWQLAFFIVTIIISLYVFSANYLSNDPAFADMSDDYKGAEDSNLGEMKGKISSVYEIEGDVKL